MSACVPIFILNFKHSKNLPKHMLTSAALIYHVLQIVTMEKLHGFHGSISNHNTFPVKIRNNLCNRFWLYKTDA